MFEAACPSFLGVLPQCNVRKKLHSMRTRDNQRKGISCTDMSFIVHHAPESHFTFRRDPPLQGVRDPSGISPGVHTFQHAFGDRIVGMLAWEGRLGSILTIYPSCGDRLASGIAWRGLSQIKP